MTCRSVYSGRRQLRIINVKDITLREQLKKRSPHPTSGCRLDGRIGNLPPYLPGPIPVSTSDHSPKKLIASWDPASAETLRDNSTPGNTSDTYPPFAFEQLDQAILNAYSVAGSPNSTIERLASAYNHLYQQIEAFKKSRLKPLKISLAEENASFVLNSNRLSVNGMSARITDSSLEEDRYDSD